jgi:hypothetical protein
MQHFVDYEPAKEDEAGQVGYAEGRNALTSRPAFTEEELFHGFSLVTS